MTSLLYVWQGETRSIEGLGPDQNRTAFEITYNALVFDRSYGTDHDKALGSDVEVTAPGQFQVTLTQATIGCAIGDVGTYTYSLSESGRILTVDTGTDSCAVRAAALPGQWQALQCGDQDNACLGPLDPGEHRTTLFDPRVDAAGWTFNYGGLSYVVPAGWRNPADEHDAFELAVPPDVVTTEETYHSIIIFPDPAIVGQDAACSASLQPGAGRSVAELTAWTVGQKGLTSTPPVDITINGRAGKMFDARQAPSWKGKCSPLRLRFADPLKSGEGWDWGMSPPEHWRVILLDIGGGHVVLIILDDSSNPSRFDELVTNAMPVVQSFVFR